MPEFLKYLGGKLRGTYDRVVGKPLPWSMIDKLAALDERGEQSAAGDAGRATPARPSDEPRPSDPNANDRTTR